jgi:hypothetical protein
VQNSGSSGTANTHWRESVLANELMTGYINSGRNVLSLVTIRSLTDFGYTVDPDAADPFSLAFGVSAQKSGTAGRLPMPDDVDTGPIYQIGRNGRPVRIR